MLSVIFAALALVTQAGVNAPTFTTHYHCDNMIIAPDFIGCEQVFAGEDSAFAGLFVRDMTFDTRELR